MKNLFWFLAVVVLVLPGCFRTRSDIAREKEEDYRITQDDAQQSARLDNIEAQFGKFQGQIEEQQYQRKQDARDLRAALDKNDKHIADIDEKISALSQKMELLFEEVKKMKEGGASVREAKSSASSKKKPAGNVSEGIKAFKAQDFDSAASEFEGYLEKYPKGKRALEASYYLGEVRYHEKDYARAILAYSMVHERSPATSLGRKSTLKIVESFSALGKKSDAKSFAQLLVQVAPASAEAKKVRKYLK